MPSRLTAPFHDVQGPSRTLREVSAITTAPPEPATAGPNIREYDPPLNASSSGYPFVAAARKTQRGLATLPTHHEFDYGRGDKICISHGYLRNGMGHKRKMSFFPPKFPKASTVVVHNRLSFSILFQPTDGLRVTSAHFRLSSSLAPRRGLQRLRIRYHPTDYGSDRCQFLILSRRVMTGRRERFKSIIRHSSITGAMCRHECIRNVLVSIITCRRTAVDCTRWCFKVCSPTIRQGPEHLSHPFIRTYHQANPKYCRITYV